MSDLNSTDTRHTVTYQIGGHVVGLFDVLGQQEILRSWKRPNQDDPSASETLRAQLRQTAGVIRTFRSGFRSAFNSFARGHSQLRDSLPADKQTVWDSLSNHPLKLFGFSDTVVAHVAVETTRHKAPTRGVYGLFAATALMQLGQLARGFPIRGGIDLEVGFEIDEDEIYGPALIRAYALESEIAQYPRVVIGDELMGWLRANAAADATDVEKVNKAIAERTLSEFVAMDVDDRPIIDFLGLGIRSMVSYEIPVAAEVKKAVDFVSGALDRFRQKRDMKLAMRYLMLSEYFQQRLNDWPPLSE